MAPGEIRHFLLAPGGFLFQANYGETQPEHDVIDGMLHHGAPGSRAGGGCFLDGGDERFSFDAAGMGQLRKKQPGPARVLAGKYPPVLV